MPYIDRRYLIAGLIVVLLIAFVGGMKYRDLKQEEPGQEIIDPGTSIVDDQTVEAEEIQVYVTGEVDKPGMYKLKPGARVYDALEMAGILPAADLKSVQPARKLQDGETIELLAEGESPAVAVSVSRVNNNPVPDSAPVYQSNGLLNINTASAQELDNRLPGIGPTLAQRIVDYRTSNGPFASIEDINNVSGIGDKKFAYIKDMITVK